MSDARLCGKPKKDGTACGQVLGDSDRQCIWHGDGIGPEDRSALARLGGLKHVRVLAGDTLPADVFTARGILTRLQTIEHAIVTGGLAPEVGKAAAYTLSVAKAVAELAVHAQIRELERRLQRRGA
jgi:hypothetical protein